MANEQPADAGSEPSIEQRLASVLGADASEPRPQPEGPEDVSASTETEPEEQPTEVDSSEETQEGVYEIDGEQYSQEEVKSAVHGYKLVTKTQQELAEHRRAVAAKEASLKAQEQFQATAARIAADYQSVQMQIEPLSKALKQYANGEIALDSDTVARAQIKLNELVGQANSITAYAQQARQQLDQSTGQMVAEFARYRSEALKKAIPGWGSEADVEATRAALSVGFTPDEITKTFAFDARTGVLAWKAAQYDKLQSGKSAALTKAKAAPPVVKPGASQGERQVAGARYAEARKQLKKSGSIDDAARLFERFMK